MSNTTSTISQLDPNYVDLWGFGLLGGAAVVLAYTISKICLVNFDLFSASSLTSNLDHHLKRKKKTEREKLRDALFYEQVVLYGFGIAEVVDCVTDWLSIFRMHEEIKFTEKGKLQLNLYAFLGGCSVIVASWSLLQRAAIQSVINEEIHDQFIEAVESGVSIKQARTTHFVSRRNESKTSDRSTHIAASVPSDTPNPDGNEIGKKNSDISQAETTRSKSAVENLDPSQQPHAPKRRNSTSDGEKKLDSQSASLAKEYAVIERKMLLMKRSLLLLFVEDLPSIVLNATVYIPQGVNIPIEALLSVGISIGVIGYKVSLFEKLKLMKKREGDIEIVFKQMSESQLKDAKLKIMEELHKTNSRLMTYGNDTHARKRAPRNIHGSLQRKDSVSSRLRANPLGMGPSRRKVRGK